MIVLKRDIEEMLRRGPGEGMFLDVDFGKKRLNVRRDKSALIVKGGYMINLRVKLKDNVCYLLKKEGLIPIAFFDEETRKFYKLMPTVDWPTVTIGSVPMHRVKMTSPRRDTEAKIKLVKPEGIVLDTCMGLGYTAIMAAGRSKIVYTFEKDKNIYLIARLNPCSSQLFSLPNIRIKRADVVEYIKKFPAMYFDCIIHDPPTFKISPGLYSVDFYHKLYRVLKRKGKLFHYAPFYGIKKGKDFPARIKVHLKEAGFNVLRVDYNVGGILCRRS